MPEKMNKVLVCITPQSNSRRLINKGREAALARNAELHILHVEKGVDIFSTPQSKALLQELFLYGAGLGGVVHGLCGDDVFQTIRGFIKTEGITHVVLGEPPRSSDADAPSDAAVKGFADSLNGVETIVIQRDDG